MMVGFEDLQALFSCRHRLSHIYEWWRLSFEHGLMDRMVCGQMAMTRNALLVTGVFLDSFSKMWDRMEILAGVFNLLIICELL